MKNYIANGASLLLRSACDVQIGICNAENGTWDTSKALARRVIEKCIHHGRLHRANGQQQDEYEAYRLLGTAVCSVFVMISASSVQFLDPAPYA
jgi:hypothetical protein